MSYPIIYLTLGYPTERKFFEILKMLDTLNLKAVEIGIPDSDPKLDGKIIRASHNIVMRRGYTSKKIHTMLETIMHHHNFETVLMGYYKTLRTHSIIGNKSFKDAHLLCVDKQLTYHDHPKLIQLYHTEMDNDSILKRLKNNSLFVYLMTNRIGTGIALNPDEGSLQHTIETLKNNTPLPVCLGFGIKAPKHATVAAKVGADGIIIGSEFIKRSLHASVDDLKNYVIAMRTMFNMSQQ